MLRRNAKKIIVLVGAIAVITGVLFFIRASNAQQADLGLQAVSSTIGLPTTDIRVIVANIIRIALGLLGIIAVVLIIYAGFTWMTAGGNEEKIASAKKILINAVIGLIIILSSYALTSFIINKLIGATTGNGKACVGDLCTCTGPTCSGGYFTGFYISNLPQGGQLCIRNVHLAVTFTANVDISTLPHNLIVRKDSDNSEQTGQWLAVDGNTAEFVPNGVCGDGINDCYAANTNYTLHFVSGNTQNIKSVDDAALTCGLSGCTDVQFTTGDGVDRQPPTVKIEPINTDALVVGQVVPVQVSFTDDNGVQKLDLRADSYFVSSTSLLGCQKSGSVILDWPTNGLQTGTHTLLAKAFDWSMQQDATSTKVILRPTSCENYSLDPGEEKIGPPACCKVGIDCGCGQCAGTTCTGDGQCASGFCKIVAGQTIGVCVDRARINAVSPASGAPNNFVSISGDYFGDTAGHVYFSSNASGGWVEAALADCGAGAWKTWQIIANVPQSAVAGPIKVETSDYANASSTDKYIYTDATNDDFGPVINDFIIDNIKRPGLCSIAPPDSKPGADTTISGKNFGNTQGQVFFGQLKAIASNWSDNSTNASTHARVPVLVTGPVGVFVSTTAQSNSIRFFVDEGVNSTTPVIYSITPDNGAQGEYITVTGKNFGNLQGLVWFKLVGNANTGDNGDFSFPAECKHPWSDTQIIVKFPQNSSLPMGDYYIQVKPPGSGSQESPAGVPPVFSLQSGSPRPGICNISPVSGPVPFATSSPSMTITGEYFGTDPQVYFWKANASSTSVANRLRVPVTNLVSKTATNLQISSPPAATQSGPVVVYSNSKISNPDDFTVLDCTKNNNICNDPLTHCCVSGGQAGMCQPNGTLCDGETLSSGYIWRFSTRDIPALPRVVERCEDDGTTTTMNSLPTPSPSTLWDGPGQSPDAEKVCRTALVEVELSAVMNQSTVNHNTVQINACSDTKDNNCIDPAPVALTPESFNLLPASSDSNETHQYLELKTVGGLQDDQWYQVVLKSDIKTDVIGPGNTGISLFADKPCGDGTSYCFVFKTDTQACKMRAVIVTPYKYWTTILEAPIIYHNVSTTDPNLYYRGNGLSDQRCIMMDVSGFNWNWSSANTDYAAIYNGGHTQNKVTASALGNTVAVGLPDDSVDIKTDASTGTLHYPGRSPLTIDLSRPEVVDYWPNCLEACTNAEVGVRFNTTMSNHNISPFPAENGPIQLLKCNDENCSSTVSVVNSSDIILDPTSDPAFTVIKIANSKSGSIALQPNTIYEVILSASTTPDPGSPLQLWSAAKFGDPDTYSKPYNKEFTWRFRTKNVACKIDHAGVAPSAFTAVHIDDRAVYNVQPFSAPDACSANGQKLNPWSVSWDWMSVHPDVAKIPDELSVKLHFNTKLSNPYCTNSCILKGSSIPSGTDVFPVCGNGIVEAGEDCDVGITTTNCGLNCLFINKTNTGSEQSTGATSVSSSICGNGYIGTGEDCDLGIPPSISSPTSSMLCSGKCLHLGTQLTSQWCFDNSSTFGGFPTSTYTSACSQALSQCGDGVQSPDEDRGCDLGGGQHASWCNDYCLAVQRGHGDDCDPTTEGCRGNGQHLGSSLVYTNPSVCGDGEVGTGEDDFCETAGLLNIHNGLGDPWMIVIGVGESLDTTGTPPSEQTDIIAQTTQNTQIQGEKVEASGKFIIPCGYKTDEDCKNINPNYALGADSCCYARPKLTSVYPGATSSNQENICPNTVIEADFNKVIDKNTLPGNLIIAEGVGQGVTAPTLAKSFTYPGANNFVSWYNRFAYFTNGNSGLHIIDTSNSANQHEVGSINSSGPSSYSSMYIVGTNAYIADEGLKKFTIIDVSSSTKPEEVGSVGVSAGTGPSQVYVSYNYAYTVNGQNGGMSIINISNSSQPVLTASAFGDTDNERYEKIYVTGHYLYATENTKNNFVSFDVSSSTNPVQISTTSIKAGYDFDVSGNYAYLAAGPDGLEVMDISDPFNPHGVGSYFENNIDFRNVYIYNNLLFAVNPFGGSPGIYVFDISDPVNPKKLGFIDAETLGLSRIGNINVVGNYAYVAYGEGLAIIDISQFTNNCYFNSGNDVTSLIILADKNSQTGGPWYQNVWTKIVMFFRHLFGGVAVAQSPLPAPLPARWCSGLAQGTPTIIPGDSVGTSRISVKLSTPLDTDSYYSIILKDGIRDVNGVSIGSNSNGTNINWKFVTGPKICEVNGVSMDPPQVYLSKVGATTTLLATAVTSGGARIQPVDGYAWDYLWGPANLFVNIEQTTSSANTISAQNRNGEIDVRAGAVITDNKFTATTGMVATGKTHVIVFLCENPWPPKGLILPGDPTPHVIFPYQDMDGNNDGYDLASDTFDNTQIPPSTYGKYFNFSTYYCADNGNFGTADDLPYLRPAVQVSSTVAYSPSTVLKRFIFTNSQNSDAIGIQVFPNSSHLTVGEWFQNSKENGGQGFVGNTQAANIDGYDAISDGNNIYIDALNLSTSTPVQLYTNIYLFSINSDAQPETRKVFDQLMSNLKFNINLTNYGYCGVSMDKPGVSTTCATDLDCSGGEICSVQTDKLKRDYQRLRDLRDIQSAISQ